MGLPNSVSAESVDLESVSKWTSDDLQQATGKELKAILLRIKRDAWKEEQPEKYWAYRPSSSGTKIELIERIVSPTYESRNKYKKVQNLVMIKALYCKEARSPLFNFVLRKGPDGKEMEGDRIEHWLFKKNVINEEFKGGKGNPFTVFKLDSRKDACRELWTNNLSVGRTEQDGEKYLYFKTGFFESFRDFKDSRVNQLTLSEEQTRDLASMDIAKESQGEGFSVSLLFHAARDEILEFVGVPKEVRSKAIVITAHRRQTRERQYEIDSMIAWEFEDIQFRINTEIKGDPKSEPDWSGGFSKHQMEESAWKVASDVVSPKKSVKSLYIRCQRNPKSSTWSAMLDLYDFDGEFLDHLDIHGMPN